MAKHGYEKINIEKKPTKYTIVGHSCLLSEFHICMTVGGMRTVLDGLDDEDLLHITIKDKDDGGMPKATEWSVSKAIKKDAEASRAPRTSEAAGIHTEDSL